MTAHPVDHPNWTRKAPPERDRNLAPEHRTETVPSDVRTINGWGVDLDWNNRPPFPRELPSNVKTVRGEVRVWQKPNGKVLTSIEHPNITPVFGNVCPPKGISGLLRQYAFRYSEATSRHWMTLMLADRVDVVESMLTSALRGKPDRYVKEKGWTAKVKYGDTRQRAKYAAFGALAIGAMVGALVLRTALSED